MHLTLNNNTVQPVQEQFGRSVLVLSPCGIYEVMMIDYDKHSDCYVFYDPCTGVHDYVSEVEWWALLPEEYNEED